MTSETDAEFLGRYWEELNWDTEDADFDRLFSLARRGVRAARKDLVKAKDAEAFIEMLDDGVKELQEAQIKKQADRIEQLEAALREIAKVTRGWEPGVWSEKEGRQYFSGLFFSAQKVARAALGGERLSNITHEVRDNPEKIWLEPGCSPERCWSETRLDDCEEHGCGAKAVAYVREDIVDALRAVINALGEQLATMIDNAAKAANPRAKLERLCDAAQAVIRVADRTTIEFDGLKAAIASAHTDDKRAHSAFANSENASKGEQRTICEACGNANLAHDRAAWADDGASYCPECFQIILAGPLPPPPAGEPMKLNIDEAKFLAAVDREGDHEIGAGSVAYDPLPQKEQQ